MLYLIHYQPLHPRWVTVSGKRFHLRWGREDDLYTQAKRLPGSKYQAPCVTVPLAEWQEVTGFAEIHDLRLAPSAVQAIEAMQEARLKALITEVSAPKKAAKAPQKLDHAEQLDGYSVATNLTMGGTA